MKFVVKILISFDQKEINQTTLSSVQTLVKSRSTIPAATDGGQKKIKYIYVRTSIERLDVFMVKCVYPRLKIDTTIAALDVAGCKKNTVAGNDQKESEAFV